MTDTSTKQQDQRSGDRARPTTILLLLLLILLAFATHTYRLEAKSLWIEEGLSIYRAHAHLSHILSNATSAINPKTPARLSQIPIRSNAGAN